MTDAPKTVMLTPNGGLPSGYWNEISLVEYHHHTTVDALTAERDALREAQQSEVETFAVILRYIWETQGIEAMNKRLTEATTSPKETP